MKWPLPQDFNEAVQNPAVSFADPDLASGEVIVGPHGLPLPHSGNFADVYQVRGPDGTHWAVKCFTRPVFGLNVRYARLAEELEQANFRFTVGFTFIADGIRVRGEWRPVIKMEWVEGRPLNQVVADNVDNPKVLRALVQRWVKLCRKLREAGIAHGDIQHGNVLLVPGSRPGAYGLKLVDYDGMYVPSLSSTPSGEAGHPNFQHPERVSTRAYSPDLDRFPHLVVITALTALEHLGSDLWSKYDNGDNLLFSERDFHDPANSGVMRELWQSGFPAVQSLVGRLALSCGRSLSQTPWIDEIAAEGEPLPLAAREEELASALLGSAGSSLPVMPVFDPEPTFELDPPAAPEPVVPAPQEPESFPISLDASALESGQPVEEEPTHQYVEPAYEEPVAGYEEPAPAYEEPEPPRKEVIGQEPEYEEREYEEPEVEYDDDRSSPGRRWDSGRRDRVSPRPRVRRRSTGGNLLPVAVAAAAILVAILTGVTILLVSSRDGSTSETGENPGFTQIVPGQPQAPSGIPAPRPNGFTIVPPAPGSTPGSRPSPSLPPPRYDAITTDLAGLEIRPRWMARTAGIGQGPLVIDSATETIFHGTNMKGSFQALNLRSGEPRPGFTGLADSPITEIYPIAGGRVATYGRDDTEIRVWMVANGEVVGRILVPKIPDGSGGARDLALFLSPNGQFLVVARNGGPSSNHPAVPFLLMEATTGRSIREMGWKGGQVYFTADSSRMLLAGYDGKFAWYKLPGGEPDGGWDHGGVINRPGSMSGDGRVIAFAGGGRRGSNSPSSVGPRLLDGATGVDLRMFETRNFDVFTPPAISGDGRFAALRRNPGTYRGSAIGTVIDLVDAPSSRPIGRIAFLQRGTPQVVMAPDGRTVAVHDSSRHVLYLFEVP